MLKKNKIRIIGGKFRSRKIETLNQKNIRPTTDRIRETLFNWLSPYIYQAKCLDLFAGSGILAFEAYSRGAQYIHLCEIDKLSYKHLLYVRDEQLKISTQTCVISHIDAQLLLQKQNIDKKFDIVFCDPPYNYAQYAILLQRLSENNYLSNQALVYFEISSTVNIEKLSYLSNWKIHKQIKAGQLQALLMSRQK